MNPSHQILVTKRNMTYIFLMLLKVSTVERAFSYELNDIRHAAFLTWKMQEQFGNCCNSSSWTFCQCNLVHLWYKYVHSVDCCCWWILLKWDMYFHFVLYYCWIDRYHSTIARNIINCFWAGVCFRCWKFRICCLQHLQQ